MTISLKRGFTLVELLVVIAIISFLSSIVYANLAVARGKAIDTRKVADMQTVRSALTSFQIDNQRMPNNYDCSSGACVINNNRTTLAIEDINNPDNPQTESGKAYRASMLELVGKGKYLATVPHSPGGSAYTYYNYGSGSVAGAMMGTTLVAAAPTATPYPNSCRPFTNDDLGKYSFWSDNPNYIYKCDESPDLTFPPITNYQLQAPTSPRCTKVTSGSCTIPDIDGRPDIVLPPNSISCYHQEYRAQSQNLCSNTSSRDYCICTGTDVMQTTASGPIIE